MSEWLVSEWISSYFDVELASRYAVFLEDKEWALYSGKVAALPSYQDALEVFFDGDELESFLHDEWPDNDFGYGHVSALQVEFDSFPGWVPLATIGEEEAQFLLVKADEDLAPVAMWEHETEELVFVAASLSEFLASLESVEED